MTSKRFKTILVICLLGVLVISCAEKSKREKIDYYHWKTNVTLGEEERAILTESNSGKLYLRFFDLAFDDKTKSVLPIATLQIPEGFTPPPARVIPVVYITNEVFTHTKDSVAMNELSANVAWKIARLRDTHFSKDYQFDEIQIDCDWTLSTRDAYFDFLERLQKQERFKNVGDISEGKVPLISATLRLHQVKFMERTGIPPVDAVTLMAYNVGDLGDSNETNSIINNDITAKYLERLSDYPLPYTLALPIYDWAVLYRDGKLKRIISTITDEELTANFEAVENSSRYIAAKDTYINRTFIFKGDVLRVEKVTHKDLGALCELIEDAAGKKLDLILYHINSQNLNPAIVDEIKTVL